MYHIVAISTGTIVARFLVRGDAVEWLNRNNTEADLISTDQDGYRYVESVKPLELFKIVKVNES